MSQAPQGRYDWAKDNSEKFLLLAALIVLLVSCVWIALRVDSQSAEQSVVRATLKQGGVVVDEQDTTAFMSHPRSTPGLAAILRVSEERAKETTSARIEEASMTEYSHVAPCLHLPFQSIRNCAYSPSWGGSPAPPSQSPRRARKSKAFGRRAPL